MKKIILYLYFTTSIFVVFSQTQVQKSLPTIKWYSIEQAIELNKKNPRKIFIDVYTDWCGWCKRMDASTFSHPVIIDILNNDYYAVKFNAEQTLAIKIGDKTYINEAQPGMRGTHQFALAILQGKPSYPSTVYFDENMQLLSTVPGYRTALDLEPILMFFSSNSHSKMKWDIFQQQFKGKVQ